MVLRPDQDDRNYWTGGEWRWLFTRSERAAIARFVGRYLITLPLALWTIFIPVAMGLGWFPISGGLIMFFFFLALTLVMIGLSYVNWRTTADPVEEALVEEADRNGER